MLPAPIMQKVACHMRRALTKCCQSTSAIQQVNSSNVQRYFTQLTQQFGKTPTTITATKCTFIQINYKYKHTSGANGSHLSDVFFYFEKSWTTTGNIRPFLLCAIVLWCRHISQVARKKRKNSLVTIRKNKHDCYTFDNKQILEEIYLYFWCCCYW